MRTGELRPDVVVDLMPNSHSQTWEGPGTNLCLITSTLHSGEKAKGNRNFKSI